MAYPPHSVIGRLFRLRRRSGRVGFDILHDSALRKTEYEIRGGGVKYLILIYSNPKSRAVWEEMTDAQRMDFGRGHYTLADELADSGVLVASEGLPDPSHGTRVSVRDGRTIASDGPFAEVKEYLAGFYLVDCDSIDEAVALAARVPDATYGEVEVRPVYDRRVLEL
jgi:hypothetical protein